MSDSNRIRLSYALETTYATPPTGTYTDLRITGESLKADTNTVSSQELRSDRNIPDNVRVGFGATGDVNFELSCITPPSGLNLDRIWRYALGSNGGGYVAAVNVSIS